MSNIDPSWIDENAKSAAAEGWLLAFTVDSGRPISTAYIELFTYGPRFASRHMALTFVIDQARRGSKLHQRAMAIILASKRKK